MPDYMPGLDFEEGTVHGIPQVGDVAFVGQDGDVVAGYGPFACFGDESGGEVAVDAIGISCVCFGCYGEVVHLFVAVDEEVEPGVDAGDDGELSGVVSGSGVGQYAAWFYFDGDEAFFEAGDDVECFYGVAHCGAFKVVTDAVCLFAVYGDVDILLG